jgi:hypothetical protein
MRWVDCPQCRTSQPLEDSDPRSTPICRNCGHAFDLSDDERASNYCADLVEVEAENDANGAPPTLLVVDEDDAAESDAPVPGQDTYRIAGVACTG